MKILVIGSGAREHALSWKIAQSPKVTEIFIAPGNAGTNTIARNLSISPTDLDGLANAAEQYGIDLTLVGPEAPLASGIVDLFESRGLIIFGPTREATLIESSKAFAKDLMQKHNIPCARSTTFSSLSQASEYLRQHPLPVVVKTDGLAAGKGAVVATSFEEAQNALLDMMERRVFGSAGEKVVIEEYLEGKEVSLIAITDGKTIVPMVPACDYKRAFDSDEGPNTGGMGSYSPPSFFNAAEIETAQRTILERTVAAMAQEGKPYKGVLYAGLMMTQEGMKLLEFNARFGDPETQVILPRLQTDLLELLLAVTEGTLDKVNVEWSESACVGVVMASGGYPGSYQVKFPITGLTDLPEDILVFHAGTRLETDGHPITDGGRVLTTVACGKTMTEARDNVYSALAHIHFADCHYRKDIAAREC